METLPGRRIRGYRIVAGKFVFLPGWREFTVWPINATKVRNCTFEVTGYWRTMNLAQKIQKHRRARGMTQEELAAALDVSHQSISKWESGHTMPGLDKVLLLGAYFGVSTDYLLKEETEFAEAPPIVTPLPTPVPQKREKCRYPVFLGMAVASAGVAGIGLLLIKSLLYPPYTFGKELGIWGMFRFYIRYHENETLLTLLVITALTGVMIIILCRSWKKLRSVRQAIARLVGKHTPGRP